MNSLFDSAPGFDQPLAVLKHCHERIRKQLATMEKLVNHLNDIGIDEDAQHAAKAVLRYFRKAAPQHDLSAADVDEFTALYEAHLHIEETHIAPMASRILNEAQMKKLGAAMQARRGITA